MMAAVPFAAKAAQAATIPIIDAHIHLFDRTKPQGTFWPPKDDPVPGVSALPSRYREVIKPFGVVGAIAVEASPWLEENQWVLDQAAKDSVNETPTFVVTGPKGSKKLIGAVDISEFDSAIAEVAPTS